MAHKIENAYDAYWFLFEHPKFQVSERVEITTEEADLGEAEGRSISRDRGGKCFEYLEFARRHALETNLVIQYAKVDATRTVNGIKSKNTNIECWLEFGPLEYLYTADWDEETRLLQCHDIDLDCGASTFDEALVILAQNVLDKYGDYEGEE